LREPLLADSRPFTLLFAGPLFTRPFTPAFALAEGGRLFDSSRCREDIAPLFASRPAGELTEPFRAPNPPRLAPLFTEAFPARPAVKERVSIVRTGMCEAAAPGAVRAITERFATDAGGVETRPRAFTVPVKLLRVGVRLARLETCALRSDASVTCIDPRFTAWPFTKASREAPVTALVSRAYL
jgi:hypothetical protein